MDSSVTLEIPAETHYLRLVRLAAVDVGARAGLSVDETDDLRIAVDELCYALLGGAERIVVDYRLESDAVRIEGRSDGADVKPPNELARAILGAVVDECEFSSRDGCPTFRARKRVPVRI